MPGFFLRGGVIRLQLNRSDVRRSWAFGAVDGVEAYLLRFFQRLVPVHLNARVMGEQVLAPIVGRDEPEALGVVEPLHGACRHSHSNLESVRDKSEAALPGEIFKGI